MLGKFNIMDQGLKERERLIEEMGIHFEKRQSLPPLAARIYTMLILCPKPGHSFDDIVELSKSSKSSVSTNLKLLLDRGNIAYFTKSGDRKRYFKLSKNFLELNLKKHQEIVSEELTIFKKIHLHNSQYNKTKYKDNEEFRTLYMQYLENLHQNLEFTISEMKKLEN